MREKLRVASDDDRDLRDFARSLARDATVCAIATLWGIPVVVDDSLPPGTFRLEIQPNPREIYSVGFWMNYEMRLYELRSVLYE